MPICTVSLSANAGISVSIGGKRIWIDALHRAKVPGYSSVTPRLWEEIQKSSAFSPPDCIVYTHLHPDHFSRTMTERARAIWPESPLLLPEKIFHDQVLIDEENKSFQIGEVSLRFIRLPHEGMKYASTPHYGAVLSDGKFSVLVSGDCALANPALAQKLDDVQIDLAIMDYPWIILPNCKDYLRRTIKPSHIFAYHLPFSQDDTNDYLTISKEAAEAFDKSTDVRLLQFPLQTETIVY